MEKIGTCVISLEQWDYFNKLDNIYTAAKKDENIIVVTHTYYNNHLYIFNPDEATISMKECIEESSKKIDFLEEKLRMLEIDEYKRKQKDECFFPIGLGTRKLKKSWYKFW